MLLENLKLRFVAFFSLFNKPDLFSRTKDIERKRYTQHLDFFLLIRVDRTSSSIVFLLNN